MAKKKTEPKDIESKLIKLAEKYHTDKLEHGYFPFYAEIFDKIKPTSILEIGVYKGNSMRIWREMFPKAKLIGLDLFDEHIIPEDVKFEPIKGSQKDTDILEYILNTYGPFDIVIDDGSHSARDQWTTVEYFKNSSKVVIIEDLHCNTEDFWNEGLSFDETILGKVKNGSFPYKHEIALDKIIAVYVD